MLKSGELEARTVGYVAVPSILNDVAERSLGPFVAGEVESVGGSGS